MLDRAAALVLIGLVAALFGQGADADTYFFAVIVPTALGVALSESLYTVLLPIFTRSRSRALLASALRVATPIVAALVAVYVATLLLLQPHELSAWLAFTPVLVGMPLTGVYAAFLTAERRYALAIMRVPIATTLGVAVAAVLLAFWRSPTAVAAGFAAGQVGSLAVLAWSSSRAQPQPLPGPERISLSSLAAATGPVLFATLLGGLGVVPVERFLASGLSVGAIAALGYARGLALVPAMIPQALGAGIFPAATERHAALDREALARLAVLGLRLGMLTALTATAFLVVCREEIVQLVYQRREFDESAAETTARLLALLAASLVGMSIASIATRALFAVGRRRLVAAVSTVGTGIYVGAAIVLRELAGLEGLAAAFSVASLAGGAILAAYLASALGVPVWTAVREWLVAPALLAAVFAAGAWLGWVALESDGQGFAGAALTVLGSLAAGLLALVAVVFAVRGTEYGFLRSALARRSLSPAGEPTA